MQSSLSRYFLGNTVNFIGACIKEGQRRTGTELGPEFMRKHDLRQIFSNYGLNFVDQGDIKSTSEEQQLTKSGTFCENSEILGTLMQRLHTKVEQTLEKNEFCFTFGGDHSLAIGSISAYLKKFPDLKIIWVDAHADLITPNKSEYPFLHGYPVSFLMNNFKVQDLLGFEWYPGVTLKKENIVFIALRDVEANEKQFLKENNINAFSMYEVKEFGIGQVMQKAFELLKVDQHPLYLSFDIDGVDPMFAPATGTQVRAGLTDAEALYLVRKCRKSGALVGAEITEFNPLMDSPQENYFGDVVQTKGIGKTDLFCLELTVALLGKDDI